MQSTADIKLPSIGTYRVPTTFLCVCVGLGGKRLRPCSAFQRSNQILSFYQNLIRTLCHWIDTCSFSKNAFHSFLTTDCLVFKGARTTRREEQWTSQIFARKELGIANYRRHHHHHHHRFGKFTAYFGCQCAAFYV